MRIASLEVIPYALPFREPYVTARGTLERREMVLLRLRDEEGLVGLGEAVPLSLRDGASLEEVAGELARLDELDRYDEEAIGSAGLSAPARCAALTALLDLRGRRTVPREQAGPPPPPVPCNATLVAGEPAAVAGDAEGWAAEGFSTFKLKLGTGEDIEQVRAVRAALGAGPRIRVDVNGSWSAEVAKRALAELEELEIELAEQPVASLEEAAQVAATTSIPLAGDESIESREDAEQARLRDAFQVAGIKLSKVGGPEAAVEIAEVLPSYISSALDGPAGIAAAGQVAQTLEAAVGGGPGLAHGLATQRLFASTIAAVECELRGGMLHPPAGPGLGVEIDEAALDAHRI